jgi:hypothetical protein
MQLTRIKVFVDIRLEDSEGWAVTVPVPVQAYNELAPTMQNIQRLYHDVTELTGVPAAAFTIVTHRSTPWSRLTDVKTKWHLMTTATTKWQHVGVQLKTMFARQTNQMHINVHLTTASKGHVEHFRKLAVQALSGMSVKDLAYT